MSRQSATGRGRPAAVPNGHYDADPLVQEVQTGLCVVFTGEDNRPVRFSFAALPLPRLHDNLAHAFARRVGPTGGLRTEASARSTWAALSRLVRFLADLARPPTDLSQLRASHLARYRLHRLGSVDESWVMTEIHAIRLVLEQVRPVERLSPDVIDYLAQRGHLTGRHDRRRDGGVPGYSEREFTAIMRAARSDAAAIRSRIRDGEALHALAQTQPDQVPAAQRDWARELTMMARDGAVPDVLLLNGIPDYAARWRLAGQLFLLSTDLPPLLVLAVGLSGRNGETVKELPTQHRTIEDQAVAVNLTKRRRGKANSRETVHWEIGADSRQLHTPGGFYLLLHALTARGRALSGSTSVWSIWATELNGDPAKKQTNGHIDPFARRLGRAMHLDRWAHRHGLLDDNGKALTISTNRLKTSVEVRRARATGGHLPSTARTHSMDMSFLHYLRNDPRIRDWADRVLTDALHDAEAAAREAHLRIVDAATRAEFLRDPAGTATRLGTTPDKVNEALDGELDTLVSSCLDHDHGPHNEGPCQASFLTCLRCPNALVLERHLPMLLALLDYLQQELDTTDVGAWCRRHGITWLIITRLILPKFTDAQRTRAAAAKPARLPLALLHGPQELT